MKSRLVQAIRAHYVDEAAASSLEAIHAENLIETLWETEHDPRLVNKKRKNLNSVRSAINVDLQKLFKSGGNPDGITINTDNIFVMSDEAKDKALNSFLAKLPGDMPASLDKISEILNAINAVLADPAATLPDDPVGRLKKLSEMKALVKGLSDQIDRHGATEDRAPEDGGQGDGAAEDRAPEDRDPENRGPEDGAPEDGAAADSVQTSEDRYGNRDIPGNIAEDTDIIELEDDVEDVEVLEDDEFEEVDELGGGDTGEGPGGRGSEDGVPEDRAPEDGAAADSVQTSEDSSGNGDIPGDIAEDTDIIELEDDVEDIEVLEDEEVKEVDGLGGGDAGQGTGVQGSEDGGPEDRGQKPEAGGPEDGATEDGGPEDSGQTSENSSGDGDIPGDIEEDTDVTELEDDVEDVEVLEDDEFEAVDELPGDGRDGGFGQQGKAGDLGSRSEDNHLDAIESGHDPLQPNDPQKARLLAETFNRSLAAMDKFFNQYIEFPGGEYTVGAEAPKSNEILQHTVSLASFFMGKFPVTNALFEVFIENTGYVTTAEKIGFGTVYDGRCQTITDPRTAQSRQIWRADITSRTVEGACWYQPSGPGSTIHNKRNHPVVQVSAHDALAFSAWTGKRLPLEAEWEAATRTIKANIFPWGNDMQPGACNVEESSIGDTTPVDNYTDFENNAGIADALGNVLEWAFCQDNTNGAADQSAYYVAKGGSWVSSHQPHLYSRVLLAPEMHSNIMGFRCVAS